MACVVLAVAIAVLEEISATLPGPMLAVAGGVVLGRLWGTRLRAGGRIAGTFLLRAGIVLLGVRLSLSQIQATGSEAALVILPSVAIGGLTAWFAARRIGLAPELAALLAVGTAICGNSAVAATAPLIEASEEDVAAAVATVTLYGSIALVAFPLIGAAAGLSDHTFGLWAGSAINDTSQVVASAFSFSTPAGETATVVKLTRNLFILPAVLLVPVLPAIARHRARRGSMRATVPWFVLAFLVVAASASLVSLPDALKEGAANLSKVLILAALVGIGVGAASLRMTRRFLLPVGAGLGAGVFLAVCSFLFVSIVD
ncbi:MAG: YeiH family protein [Actinomycetota bacterium]